MDTGTTPSTTSSITPTASRSGSNNLKTSHSKQAACLNCRRSKIRCNRKKDDTCCEKCRQANLECIVPEHHVGRQKGVKNKRKGLEKALHQIEQAIQRPNPKTNPSGSDPGTAKKVITNLQDLLDKAQGHLLQIEADDFSHGPAGRRHGAAATTTITTQSSPPLRPRETSIEDSLTLDDAENPLQLLARASDLQLSPVGPRNKEPKLSPEQSLSSSGMMFRNNNNNNHDDDDSGAKAFFVPIRAVPDVGPGLDPIDIGLLTYNEAERLFSFFYQDLAHTRWGLDPLVHSVTFVRTGSAFLFTSILAASALFIPSAAALSNRLSRHCRFLAQQVISQRYRSVEIVIAFMVNVPWMAPGDFMGDDDTCSYIAMALTVALDLSLNKIVTPSSILSVGTLRRLSRADCIDAKKALNMDGFDQVDPDSEWGRRLSRRRERTWIALFVVERGVCLARGRSYTVPPTALIENCDRWHISDIADSRDGPLNSMAVLRRDLDGLFRRVRLSCDSHQVVDTGSETAQSIKKTIENFYDRWYATWPSAIGEDKTCSLPPYVEILVTHTQLSTYGGVINHPTAPLEVKRFFRAAGLSSALNVMRAAIQGESRLKSMPNNTVIMISFAACSALSLSIAPADSRSNLAPSVRNLIAEAAGVLERIGATPSHRNGASVLYGRFLRVLIRRSSVSPNNNTQTETEPRGDLVPSEALDAPSFLEGYSTTSAPMPVPDPQYPSGQFLPEPLHFSAMSDHQVIDAVNRAGTAFGMSIPDVPLDDMMNWGWLGFTNTTINF